MSTHGIFVWTLFEHFLNIFAHSWTNWENFGFVSIWGWTLHFISFFRLRNMSWEFLSLVECSLYEEILCILSFVECSLGEEPVNYSLGGQTIWNLGGSPSVEDQFKSRGSRSTSRGELISQVERILLNKINDRDSITIAAN